LSGFIHNFTQRGFKVFTANQDAEGYYVPKIGEIIHDKYQVTSIAGKGAFSCVVKAKNLTYINAA